MASKIPVKHDTDIDSFSSSNGPNVKVIARFRPLDKAESSFRGRPASIQFLPDNSTLFFSSTELKPDVASLSKLRTYPPTSSAPGKTKAIFTFDRVFTPESTQQELFDYALKDTVDDLFNGYNGCVLAYGQTGSGKTYTMMGPASPEISHATNSNVETIFKIIDNSPKDIQYKVQISYMEIYQEKVRDFVSPPASTYNLPIHESSTKGVYVKDLTEMEASSLEDVLSIMETGARLRSTGSTLMNLQSSRSHAIFSLKLSQRSLITQAQKAGQLFLVDLAGSENIKKTGASGQALQESKLINKSLSALGNIINSLTDPNSSHVPYRDSKLTRVLQEAIGGNSRTSLIITCSPSSLDEVETLTTLRFGSRAKKIRNKAIIN
ncbi:kinesin-domain-containing protein, partial [Nadsonia fulvescens var. elongata DSM 6958]